MEKKEFEDLMKDMVTRLDLCCRTKDGIKDGEELAKRMADHYHSRCKKSLEQRKAEFVEELRPFVEEYGREAINSFYRYWSEVARGGWKMRKEKERTWETKKRLITWMKNKHKFDTVNLLARATRKVS